MGTGLRACLRGLAALGAAGQLLMSTVSGGTNADGAGLGRV